MRWMLLLGLGMAGFCTYAIVKKIVPLATTKKGLDKTNKIDPRLSKGEWAAEKVRLRGLGNHMESFAKQKGYNSRHCFLLDMKLPSGRNRFFVYDLKNDSVLFAGLVTHGSGTTYSETVQYSNEVGSYCTSPGRYKIGAAYMGRFGLAYKLHGLDASNSNAYARAVVLHGHSCVPDQEVYPGEICESWGCPTVSPSFLDQLKSYLDNTEKPMLLWIVNQ
jgi:L,D-transpeptidase catalytic domain